MGSSSYPPNSLPGQSNKLLHNGKLMPWGFNLQTPPLFISFFGKTHSQKRKYLACKERRLVQFKTSTFRCASFYTFGKSIASYPANETAVFEFVPPVLNSTHYVDHGKEMRPLENRRIILQYFEPFQKFLMVIFISYMSPSDFDGF